MPTEEKVTRKLKAILSADVNGIGKVWIESGNDKSQQIFDNRIIGYLSNKNKVIRHPKKCPMCENIHNRPYLVFIGPSCVRLT